MLFGPYGLEIIGKTRPVADFFGELGKILLMFMAGLEIDLDLFRRVQKKAMTFGVITTSLPLILGTVVGLVFGYSVLPAIVIGSLLASHTLLASSTIARLGRDEARADHDHLRRDGLLRHELADRLRHLRVHLSARVFHLESRPAPGRDRGLRPADPVRPEPCRRAPS